MRLTLLLAILLASQPTAHYRYHGSVALNDLTVTPGVVRTTDVNEICHGGSTKQFRHTTSAMKKHICALYGVKDCPHEGTMELDHLVALEDGGADDEKNLWVQMAPEFHWKDKLENHIHQQICSGQMDVQDAQRRLAQDWYQFFLDEGLTP